MCSFGMHSLLGFVCAGSAFRWAEAAETELMRRLGLANEEWGNFPRRKVEAEYLKVLRFVARGTTNDQCAVQIRCRFVEH